MSYSPDTETLVTPEEIMEMVREETLYRPARRAAAFCALLIAGLSFGWVADHTAVESTAISDVSAASGLVRPAALAQPVTLLEADGDPHRLTIR